VSHDFRAPRSARASAGRPGALLGFEPGNPLQVTVAICTWNRSRLLDQTLTRMRDLRVPDGVCWELLVVNNNSTDDTDAVIGRHAQALPVRRLLETKQGHSNARNCALDHADADWLVWTDDDVLVSSDWLASFAQTAARHPQAAAVGGPIDPWFPVDPAPELLEAFPVLRGGFCGVDHGPEERPLAADEPIWGANMAYQLSRVRGLRFDPQLGRVKDALVSGDDGEYLVRVRALGAPVYWSPGMRLRHYVDPGRMTLDYLCRFYEGHGKTCVSCGGAPAGRRLFGVPLWVVRQLVENWIGCPWCRLLGRKVPALTRLRDYYRYKGMLLACWEQRARAHVVPATAGH
jgi:glucosyl-dolichyl phosphate glucuronosyltransferase